MCKPRKMGDHHDIDNFEDAPDMQDVDENTSEEYDHLNSTLDHLESCLDVLEQQNDSLFAKLQELLDENRQEPEPGNAEMIEASCSAGSEQLESKHLNSPIEGSTEHSHPSADPTTSVDSSQCNDEQIMDHCPQATS